MRQKPNSDSQPQSHGLQQCRSLVRPLAIRKSRSFPVNTPASSANRELVFQADHAHSDRVPC